VAEQDAARPLDRALRWLTTATLLALIVATALAFAITEKLKLVPSPIIETVVSKTFSPVCGCATATAQLSFRLRHGGLVEVDIIRGSSVLIRRLARRHFAAGTISFRWFGRGENGRSSPDGYYKIRVHLFTDHRTIVLPNEIRLDTVAPKVEGIKLERRSAVVGERVRISYALGEVAHPVLLVDGVAIVRGRFPHRVGSLDWFGKINGRPVRKGVHLLAVEARDEAGNISVPSRPVSVRIRSRARSRSGRHRSKH
jgi:hypothetical protein